MATISPVAFTGTAASDLLRSSRGGITGVPLRTLGRSRFSSNKREFSVVAKIRKVKKHEYPWPENPDPNVPGGILSHLSPFKPLKEKPKPITLDFEKPLVELEKKINDVRKMANETGLDFTDQILLLENKYQKARKDLYTHLTPIQRVNIARHPNRPTFLDHVFSITEKFVELHGDRAGYDDPAIVTGIGTIDGRRYMFIGHQKGRNTKENIKRNFGMPTPHGYRKALRMMYYADHHKFPIVTFIDTPGAFADLRSEELGQGEAIAHNLRTMFGLKVPIISIVIGEGGSGGALAIGCGNKLLMLENAVFYVASPEACAAILWKSAKASPKAAEKLKITASELCRLQVADGIIPEPLGGAHADPSWTSQQIKNAINETMDELTKMDTEELLKHRMLKFRKIGGFGEKIPTDPKKKVNLKKKEGIPVDPKRKVNMKKKEGIPIDPKRKVNMKKKEGIPIDPKRKVNMKKKDEPVARKTPVVELEGEFEKLKAQISEAKESSNKPPQLALDKMIAKLKKEVDLEFSEAAKAMGYSDRLKALREEFMKANSKDQSMHPILMDKIEKLNKEFTQKISAAPNYGSLKPKLDMLKELSEAKTISEKNAKGLTLKEEINKKLKEVLDKSDIKEKIDALKAEVQNGELDDKMKEKILKTRKEIELELANVLKSAGLDVEIIGPKAQEISEQALLPDLESKVQHLNEETKKKIEDLINSSDLKNMIDALKLEVAKAGKKPDASAKHKIETLEQQIKQKLSTIINESEIKEKHEELQGVITKAVESAGSPKPDDTSNASSTADDESRVEVNIGANSSIA